MADLEARLEALQMTTTVAIPGAAAALARVNVFQALAQAGDNAALSSSRARGAGGVGDGLQRYLPRTPSAHDGREQDPPRDCYRG